MATGYLHGLEVVDIDNGAKNISAVKSAIIGLVGTASLKPGVTLVTSEKDIEQFGETRESDTIVKALQAIYAQGDANVLVQNVSDPDQIIKKVETFSGAIVLTRDIVYDDKFFSVKNSNNVEYTIDKDFHLKDNIITFNNDCQIENGEDLTILYKTYVEEELSFENEDHTFTNSIQLNDSFFNLTITSLDQQTTYSNGVDYDIDAESCLNRVGNAIPQGSKIIISYYTVLEETFISAGAIKVPHDNIGNVTLVNSDESVEYVINRDFKVDNKNSKIVMINDGDITEGETVKVTYYYDKTSTTNDKVAENFASFERLYNTYGFLPKILIAPGFSHETAVATSMATVADKIRAIAIIDVLDNTGTDSNGNPILKTVLPTRSDEDILNTSSERVILVYPKLRVGDRSEWYSQYLAGVIAAKDIEKGYWYSPSNTEIKAITGTSIELTSSIDDPLCEVNQINSDGITTVFNSFGTGLRVWGNRNASFPAAQGAQTFINVRRVADIIHESIEYAMLEYIDRPINSALVDAISESVNRFLRKLIARGAILDGKCWFDPAKNEATAISDGHLIFSYDFMPPTTAERISFESKINIEYLKVLGA